MPAKFGLDESIDFENVYAHLRLLDLYLLGQWAPDATDSQEGEHSSKDDSALTSARQEWLVGALITLGVHAEITLIQEKGEGRSADREGAAKCLESVLRVLVSLTHGDEEWARSVALEDTWALRFLMRVIARAGQEVASGRDEAIKGNVKKEDRDEGGVREEESHDHAKESKARSLDRLCLSLALLTNLVQTVGEVKDALRETCGFPIFGLCSSADLFVRP